MNEQRLQELLMQLEDLHRRWPAHSVKPDFIIQLEDLEEEIAVLRKALEESL